MPMANFFGWKIMSKKRAALTEQEIEAIKNYVNNPNKKLIEAKQFLDSLDDLRKAKVIPTTLVAFEVLKTIHNGIEHGFTNAELLETVPTSLGHETIELPVSAARALISAWDDFRYSASPKMEKSFGIAGKKNARKPLTKLDLQKSEKYYTRRIFDLRIRARLEDRKLTVAQAVEQVADEECVSTQTVYNAYKKHRRKFVELLQEHGLPIN